MLNNVAVLLIMEPGYSPDCTAALTSYNLQIRETAPHRYGGKTLRVPYKSDGCYMARCTAASSMTSHVGQ